MTLQFDPQQFRQVMGQAPTCVTVVTGLVEGEPVAMVIGSFVSVSLDPALAGFFCTTTSSTWSQLKGASTFGVNVLSATQEDLSNAFMRPSAERFDDIDWTTDNGAPRLNGTSAWLVLRRDQIIDAGDHEFALCPVVAMEVPDPTVEPLVFYGGRYRTLAANG